jgi:DNA methylase
MQIALADTIRFAKLRASALDTEPVSGLTHCFYKYPARFSPQFVSGAIESFSKPGDVVLDAYMGGGTTVVEGFARGRKTVGCDINSLAVFVAKVKTTCLARGEIEEITRWARHVIPTLSYHSNRSGASEYICPARTHNLSLPRARPIKKLLALALVGIDSMSTTHAQDFARCALLNVGQWALNGRRRAPSLQDFRGRVTETTLKMLNGLGQLNQTISAQEGASQPLLIHGSAEELPKHRSFAEQKVLADLVVTSPPYPGVHVLYHRWQVDGRRETPAPYWIANRTDGEGASYYSFGDRKESSLDAYFMSSLRTLKAIRSAMRNGATIVQMIAFSDPGTQLRRYLRNMSAAGFSEVKGSAGRSVRTWRNVPGRSWHANLKGQTSSSREVVLVHFAA